MKYGVWILSYYSTLRAKTGKMDDPVTGELNITRD